ncbi:hypothetical protein PYH37_004798 [Sinorhizobium numidicum]|uniref:DUF3052 domain-containing protein n=1 Tax=Sinorhizobium numidicum TaxID=680248 RepID=A0ABY8D5W9_9HYPH|nr:hypothetical protein [Sinorhizobium numidicum]WEX79218.1 hypothetical protein PYH37_004798 [Sinorhizobium numidicum]WEX85238.1 hypothetical protein PYH38_005510 [Sinorhizobium numidicum]
MTAGAGTSAAGYSGTPLAKKLGLRDGQVALLLGVPADLPEISGFGSFAHVATSLEGAAARRYDYIHVFETERAVLEPLAPELAARLKADSMLWVSWPKRASGVATTLTEDILREIFLPFALVDVKVCAVDAVWSGLKFMFRKEVRASL